VEGLDQQVGLGIYLGVSSGIALLGGAMQSARRKSEDGAESLQEAHDLLETRVRERTAELTHSNESLRSSEDRYRLLVEGVNDYAIFMLDPDGTVQTWNSGAERLKGFSAREIVGKSFSSFFTPEDVASGVPALDLARAAAEGKAGGFGRMAPASGLPAR
jgi:PAS domain-containing protein